MRYFEDFEVGQIEEFGAYEVTREEVLEFAEKYDPQPFHLSDEAAAKTFFGKISASGWHTCAMTMRMLVDHMTSLNAASQGAAGIDEIRWRRPVYPGYILNVRSKVEEMRSLATRPNMGLVKQSYEILQQDGDIVMTFIGNGMFLKRPSTPED